MESQSMMNYGRFTFFNIAPSRGAWCELRAT
jgi:hypothetical protein